MRFYTSFFLFKEQLNFEVHTVSGKSNATVDGSPCIKKCYVNKREIEIKNRPVFVLF
jgi:hypothetical protein